MPISLKSLKKLPEGPGVYFFKKGKEILYIGKATSLRDRVRSYLARDVAATRGVRVARLPLVSTRVDYLTTGSVLEALLLEAELIKKHLPSFNTREKDDKSFLHIVITDEPWPRVLLVRGKDLKGEKMVFGPFPNGGELKKAMVLIRKIFPFRDKCQPLDSAQDKPCFNAQIGLCPGVCSGVIDQKIYRKQIAQLKLFLSGKQQKLYRELEKEMKILVKNEDFEMAKVIRDRIFSLKHIRDVALIMADKIKGHPMSCNLRIEAYDIAHMSGQNTVGVMAVVEDGEPMKSEYRKFKLKGEAKNVSNDTANLKEVLTRRFNHTEWPRPKIIVVDGGLAQVNVAKKIIKENKTNIAVIGVVKNDHHKPERLIGDIKILDDHLAKQILLANNEAHRFTLAYHSLIRGKIIG